MSFASVASQHWTQIFLAPAFLSGTTYAAYVAVCRCFAENSEDSNNECGKPCEGRKMESRAFPKARCRRVPVPHVPHALARAMAPTEPLQLLVVSFLLAIGWTILLVGGAS